MNIQINNSPKESSIKEVGLNDRIANLEYFQKHNNINLPYAFQIDSGFEGPHVVFVGATHGREPAGVDAAIMFNRFLHEQTLALKHGRVTFIIGNPEAYKVNQRFIDQNMNRVFLDSLESHVEGKRAKEIRDFLIDEGVDYLFDIHSQVVGDMKMIYYNDKSDNLQTASRISNLPMHLISDEVNLPGMLTHEAEKYGIMAFGIECGNNLYQSTTNTALAHLVLLLTHLKIIDPEKFSHFLEHYEKPDKIKRYRMIQPIKPHEGFRFIDANVNTDTPVKQGQLFAVDDVMEHIAPQDCIIFFPDRNPHPNDHDAGFLANVEEIEI